MKFITNLISAGIGALLVGLFYGVWAHNKDVIAPIAIMLFALSAVRAAIYFFDGE